MFFVLAYLSQIQIRVEQTHKKTQEHFDIRGEKKEETKNAEDRQDWYWVLLFEENCIILRKSYLLLLLLLMLLSLFYPVSKIFFVLAYFSQIQIRVEQTELLLFEENQK